MENGYAISQKRLFFALIGFLLVVQTGVHAQGSYNMNLLGQWHNPAIPTQAGYRYSDVWGYAAGGREYAIIGGADANYIIEVTNPAAPTLRATLPSGCTLTKWRDHWTYQNYLYVVSDGCTGGGLQIWNLSALPSGGAPTQVYNSLAFFNSAHTITGNAASGRLYIGGADTQNAGVIVLDILGHPTTPTLLGSFMLGAYTHDMYQHNDTLYTFYGNSGVSNFDMTDISYPYQMGYFWGYTDYGYAHSGTGIKNNKYLVFTDETAGRSVKVADISDPWNISFVTTFKSALLGPTYTNSIAHNPVAMGNLVYISYYEDGLQVYDLSTPSAPVRVAYYDHRVNATYNGMVGAWGVYPELPSGKILLSDTQNGLFILERLNPFPVNMLTFSATALQDRVKLDWSTAMELNNEAFVVERSRDGVLFTDLQTVPGAGNADERRDYTAYDEAPLAGVAYYRLRQVDANGSFTHSNVISVDLKGDAPELAVFPSPSVKGAPLALEVISVDPGAAELTILDMQGRTVHSESLALPVGRVEIALNSSEWAVGSYVVRLQSPRFRLEEKLLIVQ